MKQQYKKACLMIFSDQKSKQNYDINRVTLFPKLRRNILGQKLYEFKTNIDNEQQQKSYRLTSNQILKHSTKKQDGNNSILRKTLFKQTNYEENKSKKVIGGYLLLKEIGKGGFAQVFEVEDVQGRKYAMKQYILQDAHQCYLNEVTVGQRFFKAGTIREDYAKHQHAKHIIKFIEKFRIGKKGYIIQEIGGINLSKLLSEIQGVFHNNQRIYEVKFKELYKNLAIKNQLESILLQICQAILLLNREGFIHCDLKSENILINLQDEDHPIVKIIDFGSTFQLKKGLPKITITPEYMPPELLIILQNGSNSYDILHKVDIWSIGCILLEILTGSPLWFKYKCKIEIKGKPVVNLGWFALTGREYYKIVKKQKQLCQNIAKIPFTMKQFQKFRPLLKKMLTFQQNQRIHLTDAIKEIRHLNN